MGGSLAIGTTNNRVGTTRFLGPEGKDTIGGGRWHNNGHAVVTRLMSMSGLDQGTGNWSTADGSVKQGDDAQWTAALKAAAEAKGDEFPQYGNISSPGHW